VNVLANILLAHRGPPFSQHDRGCTIHPETRPWYQRPNLDGPSDKTMAVVGFETLNGAPIAVYVNYAMHAIHFYMLGILSAYFPGATSR
jgi:neutral ceramidase